VTLWSRPDARSGQEMHCGQGSEHKGALANGVSVVIKGEAIDLEQGIEVLKDAIKAMTRRGILGSRR